MAGRSPRESARACSCSTSRAASSPPTETPRGGPTVFDYIAENFPALPRLMSIGRLDINTEGLLLLTNDGGLARVLELPRRAGCAAIAPAPTARPIRRNSTRFQKA